MSTIGVKAIKYPDGDSAINITDGGNVTLAGTLGVTGETTLSTHLNLGDGDKIKLGDASDLEIYHNGANSFIEDVGTGALVIRGANELYLQSTASNNYFVGQSGGAVTLYHNNNAKLATSSSGVTVTGETKLTDKLGIGATTIDSDIHIEKSSDLEIKLERTGSGTSTIGVPSSGQLLINNTSNADMLLSTNNTERLRIKNGGNVLVGTTNQSPAEGTSTGIRLGSNGTSQISSAAEALSLNRTGNNGDVLVFRRGGTVCGEIVVNGDNQTTSYQTSSDYRLKENVAYDFDATERLKQLKPCRFNFISNPDNTTVDGFLAHEVSSIVPEAIGGEKDEVDADGNNKYQGIDHSKLVPLLTKSLQEALTRIDTLEAEVKELKG